MLFTLLTRPSTNLSYMPDWTSNRVPDTHVWPEATNAENVAPLIAACRSASSKMRIGACPWFSYMSLVLKMWTLYLTTQLGGERSQVLSYDGPDSPSSRRASLSPSHE